jgi:hypothetical protein
VFVYGSRGKFAGRAVAETLGCMSVVLNFVTQKILPFGGPHEPYVAPRTIWGNLKMVLLINFGSAQACSFNPWANETQ